MIHVLELARTGESDAEQLEYAGSHHQAILTHSIRDFTVLGRRYREDRKDRFGILLSDQIALRQLLQRTLRFLGRRNADDVKNNIFWLHQIR